MTLGRGIALTLCTCTALFLSGCQFDSPSKSAVVSFLDAYKLQDQQVMTQYSADPTLGEMPYVLNDLPDDLITQYQQLFTGFSYKIEREEKQGDLVNVYVSLTYADCGTASQKAFADYLSALDLPAVSQEPETLLTDKLSNSLSTNVNTLTETFIVPVKRDADGYQLTLTEPFKNALHGNIDAFTTTIEAYQESNSY